MAGRRIDRVSAELKHALGSIITQELEDPRMGFVTVTRVEPAQDLKSACVFVSVLGDDVIQRQTLRALRHARGHIQRALSGHVVLKSTPVLKFEVDDSVKRSIRISKLIDSTHSDQ